MDIGTRLHAQSADEWRSWLDRRGATEREIWLIFYKKGVNKAGVSYPDAVEEALCFGWIDGQLKGIDAECYAIRFSPRRKRGNWSVTNRALARQLMTEGRMTSAGMDLLPSDWQDMRASPARDH